MADEAIVVVPYDPEWPRRFEAERVLLERVLAPWLEGGIHHIGATSVPGLAAKPVIDMMAGVRDLEEARHSSLCSSTPTFIRRTGLGSRTISPSRRRNCRS